MTTAFLAFLANHLPIRHMQEISDFRVSQSIFLAGGLALVASFATTLKYLEPLDADLPPLVQFEAFNAMSDGPRLMLKGWAKPEHWGTWTDGPRAVLNVSLHRKPATDVRVFLKGIIYPRDTSIPQAIEVLVNDKPVTVIERNHGSDLYGGNFDIPRSVAMTRTPMTIEFVVKNPMSPLSLGTSDDTRKLGLGLESIELAY